MMLTNTITDSTDCVMCRAPSQGNFRGLCALMRTKLHAWQTNAQDMFFLNKATCRALPETSGNLHISPKHWSSALCAGCTISLPGPLHHLVTYLPRPPFSTLWSVVRTALFPPEIQFLSNVLPPSPKLTMSSNNWQQEVLPCVMTKNTSTDK